MLTSRIRMQCNDTGSVELPDVTNVMTLGFENHRSHLWAGPEGSGRGRCHGKVDNAATNQENLVQNEPGEGRGQ